jgi:hypothetical protein
MSSSDPGLQEAFNEAAYPVDERGIAAITELEYDARRQEAGLSFKHIRSLDGIERCTRLHALRVAGNAIDDLTPLARLDELKELRLGGNRLTDLEPLRGLGRLEVVDISQNKISSIEPLRGHATLQELLCWETPVTSIEPLSGLPALRRLELNRTGVSDLRPLATLPALVEVTIYDNPAATYAANREVLRTLLLRGVKVGHHGIDDLRADVAAGAGDDLPGRLTKLGLGDLAAAFRCEGIDAMVPGTMVPEPLAYKIFDAARESKYKGPDFAAELVAVAKLVAAGKPRRDAASKHSALRGYLGQRKHVRAEGVRALLDGNPPDNAAVEEYLSDQPAREIVDILVAAGADLSWGPTFANLCKVGWIDLVTRAIDAGASFEPDSLNDIAYPVTVAAEHGRMDVLELLLARGAVPTYCAAAYAGTVEALDRVIAAGVDPNKPDQPGHHALFTALARPAVLRRLLELGADASVSNYAKQRALEVSIKTPMTTETLLETLEILVGAGADDFVGSDGKQIWTRIPPWEKRRIEAVKAKLAELKASAKKKAKVTAKPTADAKPKAKKKAVASKAAAKKAAKPGRKRS